MQKIEINRMENVYGIKKLVVNVDNSNTLFQDVIYSKNGVFKTSFSTCFYNLSNNAKKSVKDRISDVDSLININILKDGIVTKNLKNKFIVFSREIYEDHYIKLASYEEELELLTTNEEDKEYIRKLIASTTEGPLKELKLKSEEIGLDFEKTMDLLGNEKLRYLDNIIHILKLIEEAPNMKITQVNLKKIYEKPYDFIDTSDFRKKIDEYIDFINNQENADLLDYDFDGLECLSFLMWVCKTGYLSREKSRGLIIQNREYYDYKEVSDLFEKTIDKVFNNLDIFFLDMREKLRLIENSVEENIGKTKFVNNPILIKELSLGRKGIIRIALKNSGIRTKYWIDKLKNTKKELAMIFNRIKKKRNYFEEAINIYKKRFHPVFDIELANRRESMLGLEMPYVRFRHKSNPHYKLDEDSIYEILSSGEKTTLNIIKFIVEYISNKNKDPIIILDDIVETFDYSNRYAFIEYINDMVNEGTTIIILTHNYEFYRTLSSRISRLRKLVASVDKKGIVYIHKNENIYVNIENILNIKDEESLFFAIPYLREIKTMLKEDTTLLTSCLHYKAITKGIKMKDLLALFPLNNLLIDGEDLYLTRLKEIVNKMNNFDEYDLVKKTILSISCRVFLEEKIIENNFNIVEDIGCNQFSYLKAKYKDKLYDNVVELMEKVQLATPEFIHGNAFMYEPLVDIDGKYLKEIYEEIVNLNTDKIWKKK